MNIPDADVIVIGSGAGGAAVTWRLVRAGLRVVLLEKGAALPRDGSTLDVGRVIHERIFMSREPWCDRAGRRFAPEEHFNVGGKTKWYGAALLRFSAREFASDAPYAARAWPIAPGELAPYYDEAERLLGVREFDAEPDLARMVGRFAGPTRAWRAQPLPLALDAAILGDRPEATHFDGFASVRGYKGEAERSLLSALIGHERLTLLTNAEVAELIPHAEWRGRVIGVRLRDGREFHAARTVLAAGALHSPRLLARFLASAGVAGAPSSAVVGGNLKLHRLTALVAVTPHRIDDVLRKTSYLTNENYPHSSAQPLGFDGELIASLVPRIVPGLLRRAIGDRAYGFFLQTEDGSDARNRVGDGLAPDSPPVLDYDAARLPATAAEHRALTFGFARALLGTGSIPFWQRTGLAGTAHACGTLACGRDPADSAVDEGGRVHGLQGLYVADGSVLPRSSRVNPSLTIYAWGLRLGDSIARECAVPSPGASGAPRSPGVLAK